MSNPYLEKIASLGEKDYRAAISAANRYRTANGKATLNADDRDLKQEFKQHRGVGGRVAGTLLGAPFGGPIGMTAGYFIGKSIDNSSAGKSFANNKKLDD